MSRGRWQNGLVCAAALTAAGGARAEPLPGEGFKNHLVIELGGGYGSLAMASEKSYVAAFNQGETPAQTGGWTFQGQADPNSEIHAVLALTYYAPYWLQIRTGLEVAYFQPSEQGTPPGGAPESVTNYGGTAEVPILVGGHYALLENRLILELAAGPDIAFETQGGLNSHDLGNALRLVSPPYVGFDSELGLRCFVSGAFAIGVEFGYRSLLSPPLRIADGGSSPFTYAAGKTVALDFSGVRAVLDLALLLF